MTEKCFLASAVFHFCLDLSFETFFTVIDILLVMAKKLTEIHVECLLMLSSCSHNENMLRNMLKNFGNTVEYQIILKSVQQLPSCYKQAYG